ncbi:hypothetical protein, partial [uncultured Ruminococcus sp.]|uniref:hypothetical protein n=1 Tax=uncultured Ruminococcus sp. TaxID=165186 RepID=UPI00266C30C5
LRADFPSYCPEIPCQTYSMPAEFLSNLPKNLTTHLTHKLYAVFPKRKKKAGCMGRFAVGPGETPNTGDGGK